MLETYWIDRSQWPRETRSHLPLAQAVLDIGAVTIEEWTGREAHDSAKLAKGIRPYERANRDDRCRAHWYLVEANVAYQPRPNFQPMPFTLSSSHDVIRAPDREDYHMSREDYAEALAAIGKKNEKYLPGATRLAQAKREFIRAATMGEFKTAVREGGGYQTQPLNPDIWSIVNEWNVFHACLLNPTQPRSIAVSGTSFLPVLVERSSFDAWLAERRKLATGARPMAPTVPSGRSINDPIGPMNTDVRNAIATASEAWTVYKLETEDAVL